MTEQKSVADAQVTEQQTLASAIAAYVSVVNDPLSTVEKITQAGATELEAIAGAIAALLTSEAGAAAAEVNADVGAVDAWQHTMDGAATTESEADAGAANAETHALDAAVATETMKDSAAWEKYDLALNAAAKTETVKDAIAADAETQAIDQAAETQTVDDEGAYQILVHEVTPKWVKAERDLAQAADDYWTHYFQISTDIYIASAQATRDDKLNWYSPQDNHLAQGQILQANATFDRLQTEAKANMAWAAKDFLATRNEQWADITAESTYIKDATDLNVAYVDGTAPLTQKAYDAFSKDALDWIKSLAPKMQALLDAVESDALTWTNAVTPEAQTLADGLADDAQQLADAAAPALEALSNALADDAKSAVVTETGDVLKFDSKLVEKILNYVDTFTKSLPPVPAPSKLIDQTYTAGLDAILSLIGGLTMPKGNITRTQSGDVTTGGTIFAVHWSFEVEAYDKPRVLIQRVTVTSSGNLPNGKPIPKEDYFEILGFIPAGGTKPTLPGVMSIKTAFGSKAPLKSFEYVAAHQGSRIKPQIMAAYLQFQDTWRYMAPGFTGTIAYEGVVKTFEMSEETMKLLHGFGNLKPRDPPGVKTGGYAGHLANVGDGKKFLEKMWDPNKLAKDIGTIKTLRIEFVNGTVTTYNLGESP